MADTTQTTADDVERLLGDLSYVRVRRPPSGDADA
jgi:hypothetical protein